MSDLSVFHHVMSRSPFTTTPPRRSLMVDETRQRWSQWLLCGGGKARHGGWRRQGEARMAAYFF
ncbi:hypothetical protein IGI04_042181 [Brassica rapa subsp. trilocularis]|uniref:Uncharacterized protein n=1 Tax=Brassica rapa subsp. trilocularis TaxID=1813537 RepID=A0ABQ7KLV1_BRACM|nr:hypothetical protein IGI04_042181 [Brassica rapa subsp. trilocularis]